MIRFSARAAALLVLVTTAHAGEVAVKTVPKAILETVKARFKDAKMLAASQETTEDNKLVYEVSLEEGGRNIDVSLAPDGAIFLIEKEITFKDLPKAVVSTLRAQYPKARYRVLEEIFKVEEKKETLAYYEALLLDSGKQPWGVELGLDGKILKVEKKKTLNEDEG